MKIRLAGAEKYLYTKGPRQPRLDNSMLRGGADKSLARPGRKQSTASKLGVYLNYSPTKLNTLLSPLR